MNPRRHSRRGGRPSARVAVVVAAFLFGPFAVPILSGGATAAGSEASLATLVGVDTEAMAVIDARPATPALPSEPRTALTRAIDALGVALGVPLDASSVIEGAPVPDAILGRLAVLTDELRWCYDAAAPARAAVDRFGIPLEDQRLPTEAARAFQPAAVPIWACAARLESLALETNAYLSHPREGQGGIDLWPLLRYSPGTSDDTYDEDYALLVDQGGNDTYLNNAGGSLLDLVRGPAGSPAPTKAPARGCSRLALEFGTECQPGVALLIDSAGDDTYGRRETPSPSGDAFCTADPVVRRVVTDGAALAGVGILIDGAGNDHYVAKTAAEGSGHLAGVGVLRDEVGNDSYLALRSSQGYALTGGLGVLRDHSGNDTYDYYEAAPLDSAAGYQRPGSGGVIDDAGVCDRLPRMMQGTATGLGSLGVLVDMSGNDHYRGAPPATQLFDPSLPEAAGRTLRHSSQGFGGDSGAGYLLDEGGVDTYLGVPGHKDDVTVEPSPANTGRFEDRNSTGGQPSAAAFLTPGAPRLVGPAASPLPAAVEIRGSNYSPKLLVVLAGDTVIWTNRDAVGHTVTADDASFDSHPDCGRSRACLGSGQTYQHLFSTPGHLPYYCRIHGAKAGEGMSATVVVLP